MRQLHFLALGDLQINVKGTIPRGSYPDLQLASYLLRLELIGHASRSSGSLFEVRGPLCHESALGTMVSPRLWSNENLPFQKLLLGNVLKIEESEETRFFSSLFFCWPIPFREQAQREAH